LLPPGEYIKGLHGSNLKNIRDVHCSNLVNITNVHGSYVESIGGVLVIPEVHDSNLVNIRGPATARYFYGAYGVPIGFTSMGIFI
jgi:hypothetical protein